MDFYQWKLNLTWSYKWIICKKITEDTCWKVGVRLTRHIKFYTCDDNTSKSILAFGGACEYDHSPFIDRPVIRGLNVLILSPISFHYLELSKNSKFFKNSKPSPLPTFYPLVIRYIFRKIEWTNLEKSSNMLILGSKMTHLHFEYNKNSPQNMDSIVFMCLLNPNLMLKIRKM